MLWEDQVTEWKEEAREIGKAQGLKEGLSKGIAEGKTETAIKLIKMNLLSSEQIASATQLPLEEVNRLKEEND